MDKCVEFNNEKFGAMEVLITEDGILFPEQKIRKYLDVLNKELPLVCDSVSDDGTAWIYLFEVFEYIRYAKVKQETRWDFEEWISDIIKDCSKLL